VNVLLTVRVQGCRSGPITLDHEDLIRLYTPDGVVLLEWDGKELSVRWDPKGPKVTEVRLDPPPTP
jgi:hypothetical protein